MNYIEAMTFVFKDKTWTTKFAIGGIFGFLALSIIGLIPLFGWCIELARRVIYGEEEEVLPGWGPIWNYIINGTKVFAVIIVWSLPSVFLPISIDETTGAAQLSPLTLIYALVMIILMIPMLGLLAQGSPFGQAVNPMNSFRYIVENWRTFGGAVALLVVVNVFVQVITALPYLIASLLIGRETASILLLLSIPAIVYNFAFLGHLAGQLKREAQPPQQPDA